jgi:hypothetical protein
MINTIPVSLLLASTTLGVDLESIRHWIALGSLPTEPGFDGEPAVQLDRVAILAGLALEAELASRATETPSPKRGRKVKPLRTRKRA